MKTPNHITIEISVPDAKLLLALLRTSTLYRDVVDALSDALTEHIVARSFEKFPQNSGGA